MLRTFMTHRIRKQRELSASLWDFATLPEDGTEVVKGKLAVPGCWQNAPETRTYRGKACYERSFHAAENLRLEFKGVSHTAEVYLDGEKIASHYNAYTPFSAVVKKATEGEHALKVLVDNSFGPESALHVENDYQSYGGITRGVALEELKEAYIEGLHVTPERTEEGWQARLEAEICNLEETPFEGKITFTIKEITGNTVSDNSEEAGKGAGEDSAKKAAFSDAMTLTCLVTLAGSETKKLQASIPCPDVKEWNPDTPVLYTIMAVLEKENGEAEDDLIDRFGFREVKVEGKDILMNGRKLKIKGFCRHEDHPQFGCALPFDAMWQDLMLMRDMGANSVRTSHYPNDEIFLDLCDETGMLVWEENHARGLSEEAMRNPNFERQCEDCIREMIGAHYNHPSIYIWGILNECASHTEYGRSCYEAQLSLIRSLDQTRPRSFASCQFMKDICLGLVDVVSFNMYPLWYHDTPPKDFLRELYDWIQESTEGAGKPFLITEVGAGAVYGYRTPEKVKWSEEYQAETVEKQLNAILSHEGTSGVYVWQFCDCRVCDSWFGSRPRTMNNKGIVDEYRRPKLSYGVVKKAYSE